MPIYLEGTWSRYSFGLFCFWVGWGSVKSRYYFNSFYFMMMNVFGQDGWMMNFDQNGTFRTMVWMVPQDL